MALIACAVVSASAAVATVPLVYAVEDTGSNSAAPPLPSLENLPAILPLTDPFEWSDGSGRSTNFSDWQSRRAQIKREIEHYEIGPKPPRPENLTATYTNGVLTVLVSVGTNTLTLTSTVSVPSGDGPFAAVIGMNSLNGSLPADIFTNRSIARIAFRHNQVVTYGSKNASDPFYRLYPDLFHAGQYSSWAWGVSRIIDGLELVQNVLPIDTKRLAVTGCSYAGKMALFAGAFDERIALTIAQEPGGGGAAAWRVSETLGEVEKLGSTDHRWFMESMFQFSRVNVSKLPMDHHELMAMVAPRALLVLGNPDYVWLAEESGYVSCRAAHEVWKAFGIADRFGFSIVGGHGHCALPPGQRPEVIAFVEKFLLGNTNANTTVTIAPGHTNVNHARWIQWWGTGNPTFPTNANAYAATHEAECGTVGSAWEIKTDSQASNGKFIQAIPGLRGVPAAPAGVSNLVTISFSVPANGNYAVFARLNCPTADDDSFWIKVDESSFTARNGLVTSGWQWILLNNYSLTEGQHSLTLCYREDGARLDKISVSDEPVAPDGMGRNAHNICP